MKRLIRILWVLFTVILVPVFAEAKVLKALLIIQDNYIDNNLNGIAEDVRLDLGHVQSFLNGLQKGKVIDVEITILKGKNATYANMDKLLKNVETEKDDVILFYFSGHGGMEKDKTFLFTADSKKFWRDDVEKYLKSKSAKLKIAVSDACSSSIGGMDSRGWFEDDGELEEKQNAYIEIYKNLFLNYEGLLYVTSASPGEYAWGFGSGGSFTVSFFNEVLYNDPKFTWEETIADAQQLTQEKFTYMVNMGNFPDSMKKDLKKKGITGQHPYIYSMASSIDKNAEPVTPIVPDSGGKDGDIIVRNDTKKSLTFFVDKNTKYDDSWAWKNVETFFIPAGESVSMKSSKALLVFFKQDREKYVSYSLKPGKYAFSLNQKKLIDLYTDTAGKESKKSSAKMNPILGKWIWDMWTVDDINKGSKSKSGVTYIIEFKADNSFIITDMKGKKSEWGKWNIDLVSGAEYLDIAADDGKTKTSLQMKVTFLKNSYVQLVPTMVNGEKKSTDDMPQVFLYKQ
ncbi:MAG: hypothetical protein A2Y33_06140 [Spirochaetes bacterium GWF1_51_8]|nr:MAG: hypothetical protein A2Y33_06140 [Spirochaetes bacterium GWF1_51_8]